MDQQDIPMIFRRHGDTTPKSRGHSLGNKKPAHVYVKDVVREQDANQEASDSLDAFTKSQPFNPRFIAFDKKVLRFGAYFLEAVHESNLENYRVRQCEILYYLEDDTIQVTEPRVENSGILQGNFIKRHRIPLPESDPHGNIQYVATHHLNVGREVSLYGRTFHLISADAFTRYYLQNEGVSVPDDEPLPRDQFTELRQAHMSRETGQDPDAHYGKKKYYMKEFMEASLGKFARPSDHLRRFLDHDRQVLRFYALWDDTEALYGRKHRYTIHFFLADNTLEILESYERNSGCDPFPKLLNRTKLPKESKFQIGASVAGANKPDGGGQDDSEEVRAQVLTSNCFSWQDLSIGKTLSIYNRQILLLDADEGTRAWYEHQGIPLEPAIVVKDDTPSPPAFVPPPHSGIGSDEDSLQSCYHLLPKAPLKSIESLDKTEVLRFRARFDTTQPQDVGRRFIIALTVSDQSVSILEPVQRNAGIVGGKFLERQRVKHPTGRYLGLHDFFVGARVPIAGRTFIIYEMDKYSANYMEAKPEKFPRSDRNVVIRKIKSHLSTMDVRGIADAQATEVMNADDLAALLKASVPDFSPHDAITLIRLAGGDDAETIELEALIKLLN